MRKKNVKVIKNGTATANEEMLHNIGHTLIMFKK